MRLTGWTLSYDLGLAANTFFCKSKEIILLFKRFPFLKEVIFVQKSLDLNLGNKGQANK